MFQGTSYLLKKRLPTKKKKKNGNHSYYEYKSHHNQSSLASRSIELNSQNQAGNSHSVTWHCSHSHPNKQWCGFLHSLQTTLTKQPLPTLGTEHIPQVLWHNKTKPGDCYSSTQANWFINEFLSPTEQLEELTIHGKPHHRNHLNQILQIFLLSLNNYPHRPYTFNFYQTWN